MKLFLVSAAAAALIFTAPAAFADPPDHHHGKPHQGGDASPAAPNAPAPPTHKGGGMGVHTPQTQQTRNRGMVTTTASPGAVFNAQTRGQNVGNNNNNRNNNRNDNNRNYNNRNNNTGNNNNAGNNNRDYNRANNRGNRNVHIDFNRRNVTASHHYRYRGNSWRWPNGYSYRRWTYGMTLPSLFWAQQYWISDYSYYGLAYPPPGTVWVRYGNDAVLVDRYSGEILEVVYGQFY